jgi:hypothetical protein
MTARIAMVINMTIAFCLAYYSIDFLGYTVYNERLNFQLKFRILWRSFLCQKPWDKLLL